MARSRIFDVEPLDRTTAFRAAEDATAGDGLTLEGYAAVFDVPTVINDWDGEYEEVIARGAFKKTLQEQGHRVMLMYNHGRSLFLGDYPLGKIEELREDSHGLYVRARLNDTEKVNDIRKAIQSGSISEMSFRFRPVEDKVEPPRKPGELPRITRQQVSLVELGPVNLAAYEETEVMVRSLMRGETFTPRMLSDILTTESTSVPAEPTADDAAGESTETDAGTASDVEDEAATQEHVEPVGRATRLTDLRHRVMALTASWE